MTPVQIDLHIDELVLHGLDGVNAAYVRSVVQRELTRLMAERGVPPTWQQGGSVARLDGGAFSVSPGTSADAIGAQVAHAVYGGLTGSTDR